MAILEDDNLEKVVGGEVVPDSSEDVTKLNDGICIHCGGALHKFIEIKMSTGSDTSYLCIQCGCQYVHHVAVYQKISYWMDNGVQ